MACNSDCKFPENLDEPILMEEPGRNSIFPLKYPDIYNHFKTQQSLYWQTEEIDWNDDYKDYMSLNDDQKHFLKLVIGFFSAADNLIIQNLSCNFIEEMQFLEAKFTLSYQQMIECIHSETYATIIDVIIKDENEKNKIFNSLANVPSIKNKADFCYKYMDRGNASFATRLYAFSLVENISFASSFCSIFYIKQMGKMPGLSFSNELISRDESQHALFAIHIYNKYIKHKLNTEKIHEIMNELIDIEDKFVEDALPVRLLGMSSDLMKQYVRYVADRHLQLMNYPKLYNVENPFDFMEAISIETKSNFFDRKVGEYSRASNVNTEKKFVILKDGF
jgi:ribonucleoside-diphosphate reductase beta chain